MPKIIENIREKLLEEARHQVMEHGYSNMTIRSVAKACGISVGTVYNYFPSKDMLVASFMLGDWENCLLAMENVCADTNEVELVLKNVYDGLNGFIKKYTGLFQDENAVTGFTASFRQRHVQLRDQIASLLQNLCKSQNKAEPGFLAEFIAEAMLTWTMAGKGFEEIGSILLQLF